MLLTPEQQYLEGCSSELKAAQHEQGLIGEAEMAHVDTPDAALYHAKSVEAKQSVLAAAVKLAKAEASGAVSASDAGVLVACNEFGRKDSCVLFCTRHCVCLISIVRCNGFSRGDTMCTSNLASSICALCWCCDYSA